MPTLNFEWNGSYIVLSYLFSFLGSFITVCLSEEYRLCVTHSNGVFSTHTILFFMSLSLGIVAIWSMHFIGMGAVILSDANHNIILLQFDLLLTVISMVAAIACVFLGLLIATHDRVFQRSASEFNKLMAQDAKSFTIRDLRKQGVVRNLAMFKGLLPIVLGGVVAGGGVCVMHYVGMMSQIFDVEMIWQPGIVLASVLIAIIVSSIALWIMFRLLPMFPTSDMLRVLCAIIMGVAVCCMHYTGMHACVYQTSNGAAMKSISVTVDSTTAILAALAIGMIFLGGLFITVFSELRGRHYRLRLAMDKYNDILQDIDKSPQSAAFAMFMKRFEAAFSESFGIIGSQKNILSSAAVSPSNQHRDSYGNSSIANKQCIKAFVSRDLSNCGAASESKIDGNNNIRPTHNSTTKVEPFTDLTEP